MHSTRRLIRPSAGVPQFRYQCAKSQHRRSILTQVGNRQFSSGTRHLAAVSIPVPPLKKSFARRALAVTVLGVVFTTFGFVMAALPAMDVASEMLNPPTDEETLSMYTPSSPTEQTIEDHINTHPLAQSLRQNSAFSESRPHMKIPASQRPHNLTGGTLLGAGKVVVPPFAWNEQGGKSMVTISYLGEDLCGHPGIVHGGFLATMLDEGLARCCFAALPNKIGMTANLNINYRAPAMAGKYVVLRATTIKVEGRKAWVEGRLETLVDEAKGEKPLLIAEASALFIEPRQAATMAKVYPV